MTSTGKKFCEKNSTNKVDVVKILIEFINLLIFNNI